jgi:hypothetical protein
MDSRGAAEHANQRFDVIPGSVTGKAPDPTRQALVGVHAILGSYTGLTEPLNRDGIQVSASRFHLPQEDALGERDGVFDAAPPKRSQELAEPISSVLLFPR